MSALATKRIVVTRPLVQAAGLSERLAAAGAVAVSFPVFEIVAAETSAPLTAAAGRLAEFDWLVFTSANGVRHFASLLAGRALPAALRIGAVGQATARTLTALGWPVHAEPEEFTAAALAGALGDVARRRVLFPTGNRTGPEFAAALTAHGAAVETLLVYEHRPAEPAPDAWAALAAGVDAVTFASPSAVERFLALTRGRLRGTEALVCIGPATAAALTEAGLAATAVAQPHTDAGLVDALAKHFGGA